ncbi:DUF3987 domain-containing protein [Actinokineospora inagensis]|uniref:DUF3987 domain-containing protein n=1 Tax=Actinokineospora inagensis TaxID=103730 RepID=UPI0003FB6848|nr:DUF3987 domain-containing protein [Actinokineospora inagensis]
MSTPHPATRRLHAVPPPADQPEHGPATAATDQTDRAMAAQVARVRDWLPPTAPAVFDTFLGQVALHVDRFTEADPVNVLVTLLAAAATAIGPGPHVVVGGFERHPLLTWPIVIGRTGTGRKGTGYNVAKAVLSHAIPDFVTGNIKSGLSSGEGLAAVFATDDDGGGGGGKPGRARLLPAGDVRLLAYEPEWASVMARMKREGNTLSATLRAAWEGGDLSTLNVAARTARDTHIGIIAHITPQEFAAKVSATDLAGGTYNRFLPIAVAQSKFLPTPSPVDDTLILHFGAALNDRIGHATRLDRITIAPDATDHWRQFYLEFAGTDSDGDGNPVLAQFTSRAVPNTLRIAATYAALDRTPHITTQHLAAAAALTRYSINSARAVLHPDNALAALLAYITAAGPQGRTKRDITTGHYQGNAKRRHIDPDALLARLIDTGRVTHTTHRRPEGGRPTDTYTATPANLTN